MSKKVSLEEYVREQVKNAQDMGKKSCTIFSKDEEALESVLKRLNLRYATPRVGTYYLFLD